LLSISPNSAVIASIAATAAAVTTVITTLASTPAVIYVFGINGGITRCDIGSIPLVNDINSIPTFNIFSED
jgi:hypothetical protein